MSCYEEGAIAEPIALPGSRPAVHLYARCLTTWKFLPAGVREATAQARTIRSESPRDSPNVVCMNQRLSGLDLIEIYPRCPQVCAALSSLRDRPSQAACHFLIDVQHSSDLEPEGRVSQ